MTGAGKRGLALAFPILEHGFYHKGTSERRAIHVTSLGHQAASAEVPAAEVCKTELEVLIAYEKQQGLIRRRDETERGHVLVEVEAAVSAAKGSAPHRGCALRAGQEADENLKGARVDWSRRRQP